MTSLNDEQKVHHFFIKRKILKKEEKMDSFHLLKNARDWIRSILKEKSEGRIIFHNENDLIYLANNVPGLTFGVSLKLFRDRRKEDCIICEIYEKNVFFSDDRFRAYGGSFVNLSKKAFLSSCGPVFFKKKLKFSRVEEEKDLSFVDEKDNYFIDAEFPSFEGIDFFGWINSLKKVLAKCSEMETIDGGIQFSIPKKTIPVLNQNHLIQIK